MKLLKKKWKTKSECSISCNYYNDSTPSNFWNVSNAHLNWSRLSFLARGSTLELEQIQERYMSCLRSFVEHSAPQQPSRFHDLLVRLPEVSPNKKVNIPNTRKIFKANKLKYIFIINTLSNYSTVDRIQTKRSNANKRVWTICFNGWCKFVFIRLVWIQFEKHLLFIG